MILNTNTDLEGLSLWAMPESDLDGKVREAWERTVYLAKHGIEFTISENKNGPIVHNNLPSKTDDLIVHVRPHANKAIYVFKDGTTIGSEMHRLMVMNYLMVLSLLNNVSS